MVSVGWGKPLSCKWDNLTIERKNEGLNYFKNGDVNWSPRSFDFTYLNYFLSELLCIKNPQSITELNGEIICVIGYYAKNL